MSTHEPAALLSPRAVLAQRRTPPLEWVEVEGQVIVWNETEGELHRLDPIATLLFQLCDGASTLEDTLSDLADAFRCEPEQIREDVVRCAETLRRTGLVELV